MLPKHFENGDRISPPRLSADVLEHALVDLGGNLAAKRTGADCGGRIADANWVDV